MLMLWKRELGLWNQGGGGPMFVKIDLLWCVQKLVLDRVFLRSQKKTTSLLLFLCYHTESICGLHEPQDIIHYFSQKLSHLTKTIANTLNLL